MKKNNENNTINKQKASASPTEGKSFIVEGAHREVGGIY